MPNMLINSASDFQCIRFKPSFLKRPPAKVCRWLLEDRKGKKMGSLLEPAEGIKFCQHLDISSIRPILTADLQNYRIIYIILSY